MAYGKQLKLFETSRYALCRFIEELTIVSGHPSFQSVKFRRALVEYRRYGRKRAKPKPWNVEDALYYAKYSHYIHESMKADV